MAPSTSIHKPIPSAVMLAKSVVFGPRLRGTVKHARSPRLDQAYRGEIEYSFPSRRRLSAIRPVPPPPQPLFAAECHALQKSPNGRVAQREYVEKVERPCRGG